MLSRTAPEMSALPRKRQMIALIGPLAIPACLNLFLSASVLYMVAVKQFMLGCHAGFSLYIYVFAAWLATCLMRFPSVREWLQILCFVVLFICGWILSFFAVPIVFPNNFAFSQASFVLERVTSTLATTALAASVIFLVTLVYTCARHRAEGVASAKTFTVWHIVAWTSLLALLLAVQRRLYNDSERITWIKDCVALLPELIGFAFAMTAAHRRNHLLPTIAVGVSMCILGQAIRCFGRVMDGRLPLEALTTGPFWQFRFGATLGYLSWIALVYWFFRPIQIPDANRCKLPLQDEQSSYVQQS